jgi:hypothetical protein
MKTLIHLAAGLVLALVLNVPAAAQQATDAAPPDEGDGIRVHGSWKVDIYAGEVLIERHEFTNEFVGEDAFSALLSGEYAPGTWTIGLGATWSELGGACPGAFISYELLIQGTCVLQEGGMQPEELGPGEFAVRLSVTPETGDLTIVNVAAGLFLCSPDVSANVCRTTAASESVSQGWVNVTFRALDTPITVVEGQRVDLEVVITLS